MVSILKQNKIISATIVLTAAGVLTRCFGFVNRIFLSQLIGAKELGIYQMITPIYMVVYSLTTYGITTSLTKLTAGILAKGEQKDAERLLKKAAVLTFLLSLFAFFIVFFGADFICTYILGASMLSKSLKVLAFSFFPVALKGCILAYFLGMEKSGVHASSQLLEQIFRVGCIFLFAYCIPSISHDALLAVYGLVMGEYTSFLFSYFYFLRDKKKNNLNSSCITSTNIHPQKVIVTNTTSGIKKEFEKEFGFRTFIHQSIPITANKFFITLFASIEAILIPKMLLLYYQDLQIAMEEYGHLTGMALPFLQFPATITNSLALILLPVVSKEASLEKSKRLQKLTRYCTFSCLLLGIFCTGFFYLTGPFLGEFVFHSSDAGNMIRRLSLLCPFLYLSSTMGSILNGLNRMTSSFLYHLLSIGLRTFIILIFVPEYGLNAYFIGMLSSSFLHSILQYADIRRTLAKKEEYK
ncbi:MAG: polysaccharide biosynthesis protein [Lachnospiraceae bacterium]|nr:polysaccharide biosynthesis protein [Lachnospiraceae bacterium]